MKNHLLSSNLLPTNPRNHWKPNRHSPPKQRLRWKHRQPNYRRRCKPSSLDPAPLPRRHGWTTPPPHPRRHPLRFMWQMDAEGRFLLGSDEFTRLIGARTASGFGRLWSEIADVFGLDPEGRVPQAIATRDTWSGIALDWPVDGGERLRVELSGLPMFDRARNFVGYRGFGVCRDLEGLARLDALRRTEFFSDPPSPPLSADIAQAGPAGDTSAAETDLPSSVPELPASIANRDFTTNRFGTCRGNPQKRPAIPAGERAETAVADAGRKQRLQRAGAAIVGTARERNRRRCRNAGPHPMRRRPSPNRRPRKQPSPPPNRPDWLSQPEPPPRGEAARDKTLLDLLPDRRADLPARSAALCQPRLSRFASDTTAFTRWKRPAASTRCWSSPACPTPAARRTPARRSPFPPRSRPPSTRRRRRPTPACMRFLGRRIRARADLLSSARRAGSRCRCRRGPSRRKSATPTPRNSAPSSTPRRKAS